MKRLASLILCMLMLSGFALSAYAEGGVADASQMTTVEEVVEPGMTPVYASELAEGEYPVAFKCSSSMFRIESALLKVAEGKMEATLTMGSKTFLHVYPEATLTMGSKTFLHVYPGSAEEAASKDTWIEPVENENSAMTFTIPVEALDAAVPCAAYSKNKELWYDRSLLFRTDSLPMSAFRDGFFTTAGSLKLEDGRYMVAVTLSGGSGKAKVQSPTALYVEDGACTAVIGWSSKNYDYMKVKGEKYLPVPNEDNSAFRIPVLYFDRPMPVIADTVAMSEPHEISYCLTHPVWRRRSEAAAVCAGGAAGFCVQLCLRVGGGADRQHGASICRELFRRLLCRRYRPASGAGSGFPAPARGRPHPGGTGKTAAHFDPGTALLSCKLIRTRSVFADGRPGQFAFYLNGRPLLAPNTAPRITRRC